MERGFNRFNIKMIR